MARLREELRKLSIATEILRRGGGLFGRRVELRYGSSRGEGQLHRRGFESSHAGQSQRMSRLPPALAGSGSGPPDHAGAEDPPLEAWELGAPADRTPNAAALSEARNQPFLDGGFRGGMDTPGLVVFGGSVGPLRPPDCGLGDGSAQRTNIVLAALDMAVLRGRTSPGLEHHNDRGSHYASRAYREALEKHRMESSMSRKDHCWDNAVMKRFFGLLRSGWLADHRYPSQHTDRCNDSRRVESVTPHPSLPSHHNLHGRVTIRPRPPRPFPDRKDSTPCLNSE